MLLRCLSATLLFNIGASAALLRIEIKERVDGPGTADELFSIQGSWLPFARARQEREAKDNLRLSIEERYKSRADYLEKFTAPA